MEQTGIRKHVALGALSVAAGAVAAWVGLGGPRVRRPRRDYPSAEDLWRAAAGPAAAPGAARLWHLSGAVNLREIGGYLTAEGRRVRAGRIWRSGSLAALTDAGLESLTTLGLKAIVDLRTPQEAARAPDRVPAGAAYRLQPVYSDGDTAGWLKTLLFRRHELDVVFAENYRRMADEHAAVFGDVLRQLAGPASHPSLFHCTAGKDRTGLVIAFLLLTLGVPEEIVIADYALSNLAYDQIVLAAADDVRRVTALGLTPNEMRPIMTADPHNLRQLLAHLRARYGSVAAYLETAAGVTPDVVDRLRAELLD